MVSCRMHTLMTMLGSAVPSSTIVEQRFAAMIRQTPSRAMPHRQRRSTTPQPLCLTAGIPRAHATARASRLNPESLKGPVPVPVQRRRCEGVLDGAPPASTVEDGAKLVDINFYISLHCKSNAVVRSKTLQNIFYSLEQSVQRPISRKGSPRILHETPESLNQISCRALGGHIRDQTAACDPLWHRSKQFP